MTGDVHMLPTAKLLIFRTTLDSECLRSPCRFRSICHVCKQSQWNGPLCEIYLFSLPKTRIRAPPRCPTDSFFESSQSRSPGLGNCCELFQTVEPRVHICGLPVTDPSVRALTLTVGRKKTKTKAERMSHGFRAATLLGFPQFAHLQPQVFFRHGGCPS